MNEQQAAEVLVLLRAIALRLGARAPRPLAATDLDGWRALGRDLGRVNRAAEPDPETGPPAAGGLPPERHFGREGV